MRTLMWVRLRLDLSWRDLCAAGFALLGARDRTRRRARVEAAFGGPERGFACLSVRSGLDLLLDSLALPVGSEVLVSALTIPDMLRVLEAHGLVAVPIDLDLSTMAPSAAALHAAVGPRTRALLVAHLFGARIDMGPIEAFARERGLLLIEDCAQAFTGDGWRGSEVALASLFSFGTIKTATALGGGILIVRDPRLLARMREKQATWPVHSRRVWARRLFQAALLNLLAWRPVFALYVRRVEARKGDLDSILHGSVRGFPGPHLMPALRHTASAPLLALLDRRLSRGRADSSARRSENGVRLASELPAGLVIPARRAPFHSFWVFPVLVADPERVVRALRRAGFDATRRSSLIAVPAPADRAELEPSAARELLAHVVFLPAYAGIPDTALEQMAALLRAEVPEPDLELTPMPSQARAPAGSAAGLETPSGAVRA